MSDVRITLQVATTAHDWNYVKRICLDEHYLHQQVHAKACRLTYLVVREEGEQQLDGTFLVREREYVGLLLYGRTPCSRVTNWFGTPADWREGKVQQTFWQILCLMRVWIDPRMQRGGCWHIPNLASQVITMSLETVHYDYLLRWPPMYLEEPWELAEVISYCHADRYKGHIYQFAHFKKIRTNEKKQIVTYSRKLAPLTPEQRKHIAEASRWNARMRRKRNRAESAATIIHEVLLILRKQQRTAA